MKGRRSNLQKHGKWGAALNPQFPCLEPLVRRMIRLKVTSPQSQTQDTQKGDPDKYDALVHAASNPGLPYRVQMAAQEPSIPAWLI